MEIFTSSICSYCIVSHTPKICLCLCLYRQYILYNISFMCTYYGSAPMPIQCSSMNDSEDLINEREREIHPILCIYMYKYMCVCVPSAYPLYVKRVELWKLSKYLFNIYIFNASYKINWMSTSRNAESKNCTWAKLLQIHFVNKQWSETFLFNYLLRSNQNQMVEKWSSAALFCCYCCWWNGWYASKQIEWNWNKLDRTSNQID